MSRFKSWSATLFVAGAIVLAGVSVRSTQVGPNAHGQIVTSSPTQGPTGPTGPSAFGAPNTRTLALGTALQATNSAKPAIVTITLTSTANFSLSGGTTNTADVVIGATSGVGTSGGSTMGKYANSVTGTIAVGLNMSSVATTTYTLALPAGQWFAVRQTAGTVTVQLAADQQVG